MTSDFPTDMSVQRSSTSDKFLVKFLLYFFKILGLLPLSVKFSDHLEFNTSQIGSVYNILLMSLIFGLDFFSIPAAYSVEYFGKTTLNQRLIVTKAVLGTAVLLLIWFVICLRQRTMVHIANRLISVDDATKKMSHIYELGSAELRLLIFYTLNTVIWMVVLCTDLLTYLDGNVLPWVSMMIPSFVVNWLLMQYTMILCLLEFRFRSVNRAIIKLSRIPHPSQSNYYEISASRVSLDRSAVTTLLVVKKAHSKYYEVSNDIAHFYSIPLLFAITFFCGTIIYSAYYLIVPVITSAWKDRVMLNIINAIFMLMMQLFPIIIMSICVNRLTHEMNMTADAVHKLIAWSIPSREVKSELKKFSLELLHRNVEFSAHGVFPLDCTLVHSICSIAVTYLVILVQFQRGSQH